MRIQEFVTIWGSVLSTGLAFVKGWELWRNSQRVGIEASMSFDRCDDDYGTAMPTDHGEVFAYVNLSILNNGEKPLQAFCIVVHNGHYLQQITSKGLPSILVPGSRIETRIQKEWLDDPTATALGVMTGIGKEKLVAKNDFSSLVEQSRSLPSLRRQYKRRDDPESEPVWAWQVKDHAGLKTKRND